MVEFKDIRIVNLALAELVLSEIIEYDDEYSIIHETLYKMYETVVSHFGAGVNKALENKLLKRISEIEMEATSKNVPYK